MQNSVKSFILQKALSLFVLNNFKMHQKSLLLITYFFNLLIIFNVFFTTLLMMC